MSEYNDPTVNEASFDMTTDTKELRAALDRVHQLERQAEQVRLVSQHSSNRISEPMDAIEVSIGLDGTTTVHEHPVYEASAEDAVGRPKIGILSTATTQSGTPLNPFDVKDDSLVKVEGIEMTAINAFKFGYLQRDQHGHYREVGERAETPFDAEQKAQEQEVSHEADAGSDHPLALPSDQENFLNAVDSHVDPAVVNQAIEDFGEGRGISDAAIKAAAESFGTEPELVAAHIGGVVNQLQAKVDADMQRVGIADPRAFYDWAWINRRREMTDAYRAVVSGRNTSPLKLLASRYLKSLAYAS